MLGIYNYTVVLTYLGMLISFTGLTMAIHGDARAALICLMVSGLCDMFDGKVASTKKDRTLREKRFGIQIDSLSDLICFGVLPASVVYTLSQGSDLSFYISGLYVLCALIRLAWFNVDEEERQTQTQGPREFYQGLPVTSSALLLPLSLSAGRLLHWPAAGVGCAVLAGMGVAFLTPFRLRKPAWPGKLGMLACGGAGLFLLLLSGLDP